MVPIDALSSTPELGAQALRVYVSLCYFADGKSGECYPSQRVIGERAGINRRADVQRAIRMLVKSGLIEVQHRRRENGGKSSNHYRVIHIHAAETRHPHAAETRHEREPRTDLTNRSKRKDRESSGRCAPSMHSSSAADPSLPDHPDAYAAAVKAKKRRNWLQSMARVAGRLLRGRELEAAWDAISQAEQAGSWSATPEPARSFLDRLDRLRRGAK